MSSVASILKSRIVNGNVVASIDGNYIKAAKLSQAIPALANVVSINPTTGELAYQAAGGGGGGPFLPLAGGTMDPLPNGVISAHTLEDVITIEGTPAGSGFDTTIITNAGNDLNLQTTAADAINMDCGQMTLDAQIRCEINGITVIQPVGGYTYPNNPEVGLEVKNFNNPTGFQQVGAIIQNISSASGQADGLNVFNVNGLNGSQTYGIRVDTIGNPAPIIGSSDATGLEVKTVQGTATARGVVVDAISGPSLAYGVEVNGINSSASDANALSINNVAGQTEGRGIYIQNILANSSTASAIEIDGLNAAGAGQDGRGVSVNNLQSDGNCVGVEARVMNSLSQTTTGFSASLLQATGQTFGARFSGIGNAGGTSEAYGLDMANIRQDPNVVNTKARGVNMSVVEAEDARGVEINTVYGNGRAVGVSVNDVVNTNVALPAYGVFAQRGTKLAQSTGQLMRLFDGNLGLATQFLNNAGVPNIVQPDGGNLIIVGPLVPNGAGTIVLASPPGGFQDGHWYLMCKVGAGPHGLVDSAGNLINGVGAFPFGGGAYDMVLCFFNAAAGGWFANQF